MIPYDTLVPYFNIVVVEVVFGLYYAMTPYDALWYPMLPYNDITLREHTCAAVWCVWFQGAGYPEPEQRRRRAEASAADDGHGRDMEELRHDGGHRGTGTYALLD